MRFSAPSAASPRDERDVLSAGIGIFKRYVYAPLRVLSPSALQVPLGLVCRRQHRRLASCV
jgi:hypothetical protein